MSEIQEASRNILVRELQNEGVFNFSGFIQNEVTASTLVLFKQVARYIGLPFDQANAISTDEEYKALLTEKQYSGWLEEAVKRILGHDAWEDNWDIMEDYMSFCYKYSGTPYSKSIAASGVIMTDENSNLPKRDGVITFDSTSLEKYNYIKYDLLSVDTLNQIQYFYGLDVDWLDVYDQKVWDVIASGDTDFVFQFSSPGMKQILKKINCRDLQSLAECNALYRPGPLGIDGLLDRYFDTKNGIEVEIDDEDKAIREVLRRVFGKSHTGMVIFQEDLMNLAQAGSGFSMGKADLLRKATAKKKPKLMEEVHPMFVGDWKYPEIIKIDGLGEFLRDEEFQLTAGGTITALEIAEKIQNGEEVDIVVQEN